MMPATPRHFNTLPMFLYKLSAAGKVGVQNQAQPAHGTGGSGRPDGAWTILHYPVAVAVTPVGGGAVGETTVALRTDQRGADRNRSSTR